jgi:biopolymer transport protein ExbB
LVTAFHQIEIRTGQVQPSDLAAGIWEALITTVFGLVIAIPCLAGYHLLDSQVGKVGLQLQWLTVYLDEWLTAGSSGPPSPGPRVFPARERPYPAAPLELEPEA